MHVGLVYTELDASALSIRSLSSFLRVHGHETTLLLLGADAQSYSAETLRCVAEALGPCALIGVSCLSRGSEKAKQLVTFLRAQGKTVIWGGIHATLNPQECAAVAEMVCIGEGEDPLLDLLGRLSRGESWHDVPNLAYLRDGTFVQNPLRPLRQDLDPLPGPDLACEREYHLRDDLLVRCDRIKDVQSPGLMTFIGSRGCAFHCTYCCNGKLKTIHQGCGKYVRRLSIERYVELLADMRTQCADGKFYFFVDEDFFARPIGEIREFARVYPSRVGLPFECCASAPMITEVKVQLLAQAGLKRIRIGLESGSERTKHEIYHRGISNDLVLRASRIVGQFPEVVLCYFIIIANPYEEATDLCQTAEFIAQLPPGGSVWPFNLVFFPGSELYERAVRDGLISGKETSGFELDFRGGYEYRTLPWKQKNLYLNALLYLMEGKITGLRLGLIPRLLLPTLLHPRVVRWNERCTWPARVLIALKSRAWQVRKWCVRRLKAALRDPTVIYNLRAVWRRRTRQPAAGH